MAGSVAEERIRAKAEAMLRSAFPEARIIHELVLQQGGCRIDLAAVTPNRLICVEVKSERDVLDRLPEQVAAMRRVCDAWQVWTTAKHLDQCRRIAGWLSAVDEDAPNRDSWLQRDAMEGTCNAPARLDMLWADELRWLSGVKAPRQPCIRAASDGLTGAEVRRRVCSALRARDFPRADAPIPLPQMLEAA